MHNALRRARVIERRLIPAKQPAYKASSCGFDQAVDRDIVPAVFLNWSGNAKCRPGRHFQFPVQSNEAGV